MNFVDAAFETIAAEKTVVNKTAVVIITAEIFLKNFRFFEKSLR